MTINTRSSFIYGYTVDETSLYIDFDEGSGEISAALDVGDYSMTSFATEVARAMTEAGGQDYSVSVDRSTRKLTVSASSNFSLLINSGSHVGGSDAFSLMGMSGADKSGSDSYESDSSTGSEYRPQFKLQEYIAFDDYQTAVEGSVNESANGTVEVVSFGNVKFMECNISFATDVNQGENGPIESNASGVSDLRNFMEYCTTKGALEFIPDRNTPSTYYKILLESTQEDRKGIGFRLYELYGRGLPNYYETRILKWRQLT